jgi:hypothetical protein
VPDARTSTFDPSPADNVASQGAPRPSAGWRLWPALIFVLLGLHIVSVVVMVYVATRDADDYFAMLVLNTVLGFSQEYRAEPKMALAGGEDGLEIVRRLLAQAGTHLNERGILIVEVGHNRDALERAFPALPFTWIETSGGDGFVFLLTAAELRR